MSQRYQSTTFVAPTAPVTPTVEARRQPFEDRYPVHVRAAVMEHVLVGVAWMGLVGAIALAVRTVQLGIPTYWTGVGVMTLVVGALVICYMVTWHYSQDERMRGRDLRAWEELEARLAAEQAERVKCDQELDYVRRELRAYEAKRISRGPQKAKTEQQKAADEAQKLYEDTIREIALRYELGLAYTREAMVADGKTTAATWDVVMRDLKDARLAEARGRGGKLVITAYRSDDILRTMQVPR